MTTIGPEEIHLLDGATLEHADFNMRMVLLVKQKMISENLNKCDS